ncbi:MAG TPA: hypothetical protein VHO50_07090 [Bacteroidales bacterium]|nr:hypothetical protein [Bacteroidales bacterium]
MRTEQEINFLIERIQYRLQGEVLKNPINKPVKDAYQKAIEILKNRETDAFKAGLDWNDINQHSFIQYAINQATGYLIGDVPGKLVLIRVYLDGTIEDQDDIPEETKTPEPPVIINTMTFHQEYFDFKNPVYALRYCRADGNSPFMAGCPWDLEAKSVLANDAGVFAVPLDLKKLLNPNLTVKEDYIDGVVSNSKEIILMLLESDPEFLIESNPYRSLGEHPDSPEFQLALKNEISLRERIKKDFNVEVPWSIKDEIIKAQTIASREISFSRANIIMIANYGETHKLLDAAVRDNLVKGRHPLTGFNYVPEFKQRNSWLQNKVEANGG